jgi:type IV pilus assembly protein PilQ
VFSLTVNAKVKQDGYLGEEENFSGRAISLNFQDISVRTVLQIVADYNGFNLVTSDTVAGNITLRLDGVPWDQALDIILKVKGLDKRMEGNILMVAPSDELAAREARDLQAQQQVEELAPLYSEYVQVNYAKAAEFAALIKNEDNSILSLRGSVSVDERTNTLLIRDTATSIEDIKRMVSVLDIPVRQVIIESRMVTVKDNINEELGIRWGVTDTGSDSSTSGSLSGAESAGNGIIPSLSDRLNVNLPVASPAGSIAFQVARLADGTILDLELSAMEKENKGEIIASPRITTANQKEAYIEQGVEIPYQEAASSGATSTQFKKAVLSLTVTPHITPDDRIILDLVVTQDTVSDVSNGTAPAIDTQRIGTQVLVNNGETIVLGGIYQQQTISSVSKVPVLGDIPYFGWMFRNSSNFNEKKELLIFVTPRIVTERF